MSLPCHFCARQNEPQDAGGADRRDLVAKTDMKIEAAHDYLSDTARAATMPGQVRPATTTRRRCATPGARRPSAFPATAPMALALTNADAS
jgi:hypothetical protein